MDKKKIAFVGTGIIGSGLAVNAAMHGHDVYLYYRRNFEKLRKSIRDIFDVFVDGGACTAAQADAWFDSLHFTMSIPEAVSGAFLVQESIAENLETKQEMYRTIQEAAGEKTIIASSTTAMMPSALSAGALYPQRIIVAHPYNPSYLLPLVELCGGETADAQAIEEAKSFYESIGKVALVCRKEASGFIVNRVNWAVTKEARQTVENGLCSVEDMDKAIMYGPGMRMAILGQLLTISLGIPGGFRGRAAKYGKEPDPNDELIACGIDEAIAARPEETGNTVESICRYRDKMIIEILKLQGMM